MVSFELDVEMRKLLDRIRHSSKVLSIYEMPADLAEAAVWEIGRQLVLNQQLPMVQHQQYRWYLRELSKLLRKYTGWDLALELEIALRKWAAYRLDPLLMQALVRECCERIAAMSPEQIESGEELTTKTPRHNSQGGPKSEVRMQNSEVRSTDSGIGPNDERETMETGGDMTGLSDNTDRVPSPVPNDERETMDEATTPGGGNG